MNRDIITPITSCKKHDPGTYLVKDVKNSEHRIYMPHLVQTEINSAFLSLGKMVANTLIINHGISIKPNAMIVENNTPDSPIVFTKTIFKIRLTTAETSGLNLSSYQTPAAFLYKLNILVNS